ncbi:autophagy-related protein 2 isoform X2 [Cryptomeria japonica]|uniref:autophagy-related protein 2 isoform X2 n=3 Tax=Cryptomeria japonica TaxID=3369 RepID=UPI0027D9F120|nr:autophagy-related protein 2 isoform X2 [Cryptomeria japonica]
MEWFTKRAIKFGLKKFLGKFILGELDLEGLDVQLGAGTIQLNLLQLNTQYLNQQLGAAAVSVKEGFINKLSIKIPWKVPIDNCEVELEDVVLVLSPRTEVRTSECTDECSISEACSKPSSSRLAAEHVKGSKVHEKGVFNYPGVHDGVQMIVKKVESLLLGLRVKIKNLVIAFEEGTKTSSTASGFESSCQSHSILVLRMPEIEYGTRVSGSSCENVYASEDLKGVVMLMPIIKFCGARIDLYDAPPYMDAQAETHIASILTGNRARSGICDNFVPIIEGNDVGFSGSVQLSIPWKSGCTDIPKIDAEILIDPVTLRLQLCTIERLILLFHSLGGYKGTDSQPTIVPKNKGQNLGLGHDEHACDRCPSESLMNEGMFSSCAESFSSVSASVMEETAKSTLFPESRFISNWMQRVDLEESIDEFFECFDGARSFQVGPASSSLLGLTYSVFSAITAASTLSNGPVLINSGEQRVECNLKTKLAGFSVILAIEDLNHNRLSDLDGICTFSHMNTGRLDGLRASSLADSNASFASSMEKSRFECLQQEARCWATENLFLEANFENLKFTFQVTDEEVRFKAGMKQFEIFEYLPEDGEKKVSCSLPNFEEHIKTSMLSISSLQSEVEDVLPSFPLSLQTSNAANNMANMVKVKLLTSKSDSDHQISLIYRFADSNCINSKISCTNFDVQLEPFVLWVDFYMANRLWHLTQAIENVSGKLNKVSDEPTNDYSSTGGNDSSKGSIRGTVLVSSSRVILCFPKESSKSINPHSLTHNFLCIDTSDCVHLSKCQPKTVLKQQESSLKDCYISPSSSISLNVGECNLFLISPNKKNEGEWMNGAAKELSLQARKVFSVCSEKEKNYSTVGIQWQEAPGSGSRIAEKVWESANKHWTREIENAKVIPNNQEFIRATTAGALEDNDSHIREKMIQSSTLFIFFSLPHAKVDLYGSEHIVIVNLLSDLIDCVGFDGHTRISSNSENHDSESQSYTGEGLCSKVSQISFLLECKVVDIAVHLKELLDIRASMKKELPGLWADFSLRVQEFDTLSVSNLGGVSGASYFWLSHDEGLLQGSLSDRMEKSSEAVKHFDLLHCKRNVLRRGDGGGANVLSSGNPGTTIIHVSHPQQLQSLTTVVIRCSTLIAPGGRLDWLAAVISFFSQSAIDKHRCPDTGAEGTDTNSHDSSYATSFLLELVDVAVSYEPFFRFPTIRSSGTSVPPSSGNHSNSIEEECSPVACVLAASSVCLSIQTKSNTVEKKYNVFFQDVGLLVLDISKRRSSKQGYDANALLSQGYVKIGEVASMKVVVRMNCNDNLLWEVTCNEYQILLKTCYDTTATLMRLVVQLQQLFAPDFEESFVHLQTRLRDSKQGSLMKVNRENSEGSSQVNRNVDASDGDDEDMDDSDSCEDALAGLLVGILENAFSPRINLKGVVENGAVLGSTCKGESHFLVSGPVVEEGCSLDYTASTSVVNLDYTVKDRIPSEPKAGIQGGGVDVLFPVIEDYYYHPEVFASSQRSESKKLSFGEPERPRITKNMPSTNVVDGKGVWYDTTVTVLENHCSEVNFRNNCRSQDDEDNLSSVVGASISASKNLQELGRILLKNFSVKWRMIAGSDWPILKKCDSLTTNGECTRNESACLEVELHGVDFQYDAFPDGGVYASKISFSIHDLLILDHSENAPWKKVLLDYHSILHPRESSAKALKLQLEAVKPDPSTPLEEYRLFVKLHPLRLHLDQSQLDFFIEFFSQLAALASVQGDSSSQMSSNRSIPVHATDAMTENNLLPFFQKCEIRPLTIHVDYIPRRFNFVALKGGNYAELLNLFSWKGINLHLKHVEAAGVYGWARISEIVIDEWLEDITQNQVHKLVKGAAPIRSLCAVGSGAAKLVSVPAEHYRKDRRLVKGVRKGLTQWKTGSMVMASVICP